MSDNGNVDNAAEVADQGGAAIESSTTPSISNPAKYLYRVRY
jgi:hypothetical protein